MSVLLLPLIAVADADGFLASLRLPILSMTRAVVWAFPRPRPPLPPLPFLPPLPLPPLPLPPPPLPIPRDFGFGGGSFSFLSAPLPPLPPRPLFLLGGPFENRAREGVCLAAWAAACVLLLFIRPILVRVAGLVLGFLIFYLSIKSRRCVLLTSFPSIKNSKLPYIAIKLLVYYTVFCMVNVMNIGIRMLAMVLVMIVHCEHDVHQENSMRPFFSALDFLISSFF
jgi:hypothetical protein